MKILLFLVSFILISPIVFTQTIERDILYLKNGKRIHGIITEISPERVITMRSTTGVILTYSMEETDHIVKENKTAIEAGRKASDSQTNARAFSASGSVLISGGRYRYERTAYIWPFSGITTTTENKHFSQFSAAYSLGYFIMDNVSVNFLIDVSGFDLLNKGNPFGDGSERTGISEDYYRAGLALTYYAKVKGVRPFVLAGAVASKVRKSIGDFGIIMGFGLHLPIARHMALQPIAQYQFYNRSNGGEGIVNSLSAGMRLETFIF